MILKLDDLITPHKMADKLHMRLDNLKRMREKDPYKYELLVRGAYKEVQYV